jgi:hypothetical protein
VKNTGLKIESFARLVDPYKLWMSVFGCMPNDTDISKGKGSASGVAIEAALENMSNTINATDLGYNTSIVLDNADKVVIDTIKKKLLSGAIINNSENKCKPSATEAEYISNVKEGQKTLAILGALDCMPPVLRYLAPELPDNFFMASSKSLRGSAVRINNSPNNPTIKINLRPCDQLKAFVSIMLFKTVTNHLLGDFDKNEPVQIFDDAIASLPIEIKFLEDEEILRLEAIVEFCGNYIDEKGCDLALALRRSPFRRTLTQSVTDRAHEYICEELMKYGMQRNNNVLSASFENTSDIGSVLYRLTGDQDFHLQGLLSREIISSVELYLPEIPEKFPEIALIPDNDIAIAEFCKNNNVDATIALWSASEEIPDLSEMNPIFDIVPSSAYSIKNALVSISDIFGFELTENTQFNDEVKNVQ